MANFKNGKGAKMTKSLGKMVGLLLAIYVFDELINTLMPLLCKSTECTLNTCTFVSWNAAAADTAQCIWTNTTANQTVNLGGSFETAINFTDSLFPIVGILGAFEIVYAGLKSANLL